jgi:general secretion pathway protein M
MPMATKRGRNCALPSRDRDGAALGNGRVGKTETTDSKSSAEKAMNLHEKYRELNLRDQGMLIALAAAIVVYLLVVVAWRPLAQANRSLQQANAVLRDSVQNINQLAAEYRQLQQSGSGKGAVSTESLAQLLDRTVAAQQLQMSRFQPGSNGDVQVRFDNSAFDQIVRWLHQLESEHTVTVRDLSVTPGAAPGLVNVSVRLFRA